MVQLGANQDDLDENSDELEDLAQVQDNVVLVLANAELELVVGGRDHDLVPFGVDSVLVQVDFDRDD